MNDEALRLSRILNKMKIPGVSHPFAADIVWFQQQFFALDGGRINRHPHRHNFCEVHFPIVGKAGYRLADGRELTVGEGAYLFFPPRAEHTFAFCDEGYAKFSFGFAFDEEEAARAGFLYPRVPWIGSAGETFSAVFSLVSEIIRRDGGRHPVFVRDAISVLLLLLAEQTPYAPDSATPDREDARLSRAKGYIRDNRHLAPDREEVAAFVHLSQRQLDRLFESEEHTTTAAYIRRARCEAAKELLLTTALSLSEIAERLRFSGVYNFIRFFKQEEGMTPGELRRAAGVHGKGDATEEKNE